MEKMLTEQSILEKARQFEDAGKSLYEDLASRVDQQSVKDLCEYLAKRASRYSRDLKRALETSKGATAASGDYEERFILYVSPSLDSWARADFGRRSTEIDAGDVGAVIEFLQGIEKEMLLFYYGLKDTVSEAAGSIIGEMVDRKRDDLLALQDLARELKADVDGLLAASLNGELMAKRFYQDASKRAQSEAGKRLFSDLASFEQSHYEKIKRLMESRMAGKALPKVEPEKAVDMKAEVEGEFEPNKDEMVDVLTIGIDAEKNAQKRYKRLAELSDTPAGKKIFEDLAATEAIHQKVLEDELYSISNKGTIVWAE